MIKISQFFGRNLGGYKKRNIFAPNDWSSQSLGGLFYFLEASIQTKNLVRKKTEQG